MRKSFLIVSILLFSIFCLLGCEKEEKNQVVFTEDDINLTTNSYTNKTTLEWDMSYIEAYIDTLKQYDSGEVYCSYGLKANQISGDIFYEDCLIIKVGKDELHYFTYKNGKIKEQKDTEEFEYNENEFVTKKEALSILADVIKNHDKVLEDYLEARNSSSDFSNYMKKTYSKEKDYGELITTIYTKSGDSYKRTVKGSLDSNNNLTISVDDAKENAKMNLKVSGINGEIADVKITQNEFLNTYYNTIYVLTMDGSVYMASLTAQSNGKSYSAQKLNNASNIVFFEENVYFYPYLLMKTHSLDKYLSAVSYAGNVLNLYGEE